MQNALALYETDQIHRKEPKSYLKLRVQDQQQNLFTARTQKEAGMQIRYELSLRPPQQR